MTKLPKYISWTAGVLLAILPAAGWSAEPLSLAQALETALSGNNRLAASEARSAALGEVPTRAGALPDPSLKLNAMNLPVDSFAVSQEAMTQLQVGIGQMIPFPGKRPLRAETAERAAQAAAADSAEIRREILRDVTATWWRLFYLDRALEIIGSNQDLLRQFVTIARTKYTVGKGLQQDVLLAEVELSKLFDKQLELEGKREDAAARLNHLMGGTPGRDIVLPRRVGTHLPEVVPIPDLVALAEQHRPMLAGAAHRVAMADRMTALAEKDHLPDFMVNAVYGFRSGNNPNGTDRPDFASIMLSLDIPIDREHRQDRLVAQRHYELESTLAAEQAARDQVLEQISATHARYRQSREQVRLLKDGIIPQAEQTVASMRAGYQVNKVDFLNLVQSQVTLYNYQTRYWQSLATAKGAFARLEAAVGLALVGQPGPTTEKAEQ